MHIPTDVHGTKMLQTCETYISHITIMVSLYVHRVVLWSLTGCSFCGYRNDKASKSLLACAGLKAVAHVCGAAIEASYYLIDAIPNLELACYGLGSWKKELLLLDSLVGRSRLDGVRFRKRN